MYENRKVVFLVASEVSDYRFPRLGKIDAATAESPFLKHLPPVGGDKLVLSVKRDNVQIVAGGFEKHDVLAPVAIKVTGNDVGKMGIPDGAFIAVKLSQLPGVTGERETRRPG